MVVKPSVFDYHAPATASDAVELLAKLGEGARILAGGRSLVPMLAPPHVASEEVGAMAVADATDVPADVHGSAAYRRKVGAAMVTRAWQAAMREATNG